MVANEVAGIASTARNVKPVLRKKPPNEVACAVLLSVLSVGAKVVATDADRADVADRILHTSQREGLRPFNINL